MWVLVFEPSASGGAASALTAELSFLPDSQLLVVVLLPTFLCRNDGEMGMEKKRTRITKENMKNLEKTRAFHTRYQDTDVMVKTGCLEANGLQESQEQTYAIDYL